MHRVPRSNLRLFSIILSRLKKLSPHYPNVKIALKEIITNLCTLGLEKNIIFINGLIDLILQQDAVDLMSHCKSTYVFKKIPVFRNKPHVFNYEPPFSKKFMCT